jgi:hypothetical protein
VTKLLTEDVMEKNGTRNEALRTMSRTTVFTTELSPLSTLYQTQISLKYHQQPWQMAKERW